MELRLIFTHGPTSEELRLTLLELVVDDFSVSPKLLEAFDVARLAECFENRQIRERVQKKFVLSFLVRILGQELTARISVLQVPVNTRPLSLSHSDVGSHESSITARVTVINALEDWQCM